MRQIPLLEKLNDYDIAKISHIADEERFNKGDYIVRQYSTGYTFYIILQGACQVKYFRNFRCLNNLLQVLKEDANKQKKQVGTLKKGDFFGELALTNPGIISENRNWWSRAGTLGEA